MVRVSLDSVARFRGGSQKCAKKACFCVPYLRAYCEALRYPFELFFVWQSRTNLRIFFEKITLNGFRLRFIQSLKVHGRSALPWMTFPSWAPSIIFLWFFRKTDFFRKKTKKICPRPPHKKQLKRITERFTISSQLRYTKTLFFSTFSGPIMKACYRIPQNSDHEIVRYRCTLP